MLMASMLENDIKKLRAKNIVASALFCLQAVLLGSAPLIFTNSLLVVINTYKLWH